MQLQSFIDKFPVDQVGNTVNIEIIKKYQSYLPEALLELWREHGFGFYGNGLIQIIDPERYQDVLWSWLMKDEPDMTRLPIAISAFGIVFYYRRLSDAGDEDISFMDPHNSDIGVTVWSLNDFFNEWLCDDEIIEQFLEKSALSQAQEKYGKLAHDQMYCYLPALRLGGRASDLNLDKGGGSHPFGFFISTCFRQLNLSVQRYYWGEIKKTAYISCLNEKVKLLYT